MNWILENIDFGSLIIAVIIAIFTSVLTANYAMRHFYKQELWTRKEHIYSEIVNKLTVILNYFNRAFDEEASGNTKKLLTDDDEQKFQKFKKEIEEIRYFEGFIIKYQVNLVLNKLIVDLESNYRNSHSAIEYIDESWGSTKEAIDEIIIIGNKDLKVHGWIGAYMLKRDKKLERKRLTNKKK